MASKSCSSDSRKQQLLRFFKRLYGQLAGNGWESFEEVRQRLSGLDIFKQRLGRYASSPENGRAMHDFLIPYDRSRHVPVHNLAL